MAEDAKVGSMFLEFSAAIDNVQKGITAMTQRLDKFATDAAAATKKVEAGTSRVVEGFDRMDRATLRTTQRIAQVTNRLIGMQLAVSSLTRGTGSLGQLGTALEAAGNGFQVFGAFATLAKDKFGFFAAGLAGVAVAITQFVSETIAAQVKATDEATAASLRADIAFTAYTNAVTDAKIAGEAFNESVGTATARALQLNRAAVDQAIKRLREIPKELQDAQQLIDSRKSVGEMQKGERIRGSLLREQGALENRIEDLAGTQTLKRVMLALGQQFPNLPPSAFKSGTALFDKSFAELAKTVDKTDELRESLRLVGEEGKRELELGLVTPNQLAAEKVRALQQLLSNLIKQEREAAEILENSGFTDQQKALIPRPDPEAIRLLIDQIKKSQAPQEFAATFAQPFSAGIADGLVEGILAGQSAMETLANVGENLFRNALENAANSFTSLLTTGLTELLGAGGSALGGLLSGLAGVAGFFLSGRGKDKGSQQFDAVRDAVTSTEQVRGIVAGPANVSIAAVGSDLSRALEPVREELAVVVGVLKEIRDRVGRGGGLSGPSFAGSTPTA